MSIVPFKPSTALALKYSVDRWEGHLKAAHHALQGISPALWHA